MMFKAGCLLITLLVGSIAFPVDEDDNMSYFFDHPVDPLIIGGAVTAEPVPHMVALTTGVLVKSFFCGGSIVSERFVLSAAHCIRNVASGNSVTSSLRGNVGSNRWSSSRVEIRFNRGINHPDYNHNLIKNDIGFLRSSARIAFTENVQPVALNFDFIGADAPTIANGWGRMVMGGPSAQVLQELRAVTVDGEFCDSEVARVGALLNRVVPPVHPEVEICTFFREKTGMCHGDSGSALLLAENREQIGVVSWGVPCAQGAPDMFARVSTYQTWIEQTMLLN